MTKIQKYTFALQIISLAFVAFMFIMTCARWFFDIVPSIPLLGEYYVQLSYTFDSSSWLQQLPAIPFVHRLFGLIVDGIAFGIVCAGGLFFYRLLKRFQTGEFFSSEVIQLLHTLSRIALCWVLYYSLRKILLSVITTLHKGPGNRVLSVEFSTGDIINIFIFICFVLITALIQEGSKLKKEQDLTI